MAKMILCPAGSYGDVHPFVGLGLVLKRRGHDVSIHTNGYFRPLVERAGLRFVEVGTKEEYESAVANPDLWHKTKAGKVVADMCALLIERGYAALEREVVAGETMVAAGSLAFSARIAHETMGVPMATIHLQPSLIRSVHETPLLGHLNINWMPAFLKRATFWLADALILDRIFAGPVNRFRARFGLAPIRHMIEDWWHSPLLTVGMFPEWFAAPQPDWPAQIRLTDFPLWDEQGVTPIEPALEEFLAAGERPIVFTPGSAMIHGHDWLRAGAEACAALGRRGVLLTRYPEQLPANLPESVRHFAYAPFSQLLPRCAALVHHGGIGTMSQALAAGIPQLIKPMAHDQFDNAARIERLGVGLGMIKRTTNGRATALRLDEMFHISGLNERCAAVAEMVGSRQGLEETAVLLEQVSGLAP